MKILFISQYFYPETFRGNDIAFDLVKRGESVSVVSAIPNYPQGRFYKGYGLFKKNVELINGVKVVRVPVIPRGNGNSIQLILNYFSYAISASFYTVYLAFFKKFDLIFVQQLSPVLISLPAIIFKKIQKKMLYTWVLDLWPESLTSAGGIQNKYILNFFNWFTKWEYKNSDKILISSQSFRNSIIEKGDFADRLIYFPNWAEDVFEEKKNIIHLESIPPFPHGFIVMFAGNVGECQDFNSIMEAVLLLRNEKNIKFVIVGDGRKREWVNNFIAKHQLDNIFMLGYFPLEMMPFLFEKADVMLVTLKNELIFNLTAPAKLQAYMFSKKPIIGMINGEGAELIQQAKCGYCVNAGNYKELADKIKQMSLQSETELNKMGNNGFYFYKKYFDKSKCLNSLYNIIKYEYENRV
jgi:glycosyltransferase involved in cell wall biosynthesis